MAAGVDSAKQGTTRAVNRRRLWEKFALKRDIVALRRQDEVGRSDWLADSSFIVGTAFHVELLMPEADKATRDVACSLTFGN